MTVPLTSMHKVRHSFATSRNWCDENGVFNTQAVARPTTNFSVHLLNHSEKMQKQSYVKNGYNQTTKLSVMGYEELRFVELHTPNKTWEKACGGDNRFAQ